MDLDGDAVHLAQAQKKDGFRWWAQRLGRAFHMHNETRIDHFRGFAGYWAVPSTAETAIDGSWRKGPGKELFDALTEVSVVSCRLRQQPVTVRRSALLCGVLPCWLR
jgi:4-alpha-glucanotransferase